jgi:hypothetical protein
MKQLTIEEIKNMSDEEVAELNKRLGMQVLKRYALFQIIKWAVIFGSIHATRKLLEKKLEVN